MLSPKNGHSTLTELSRTFQKWQCRVPDEKNNRERGQKSEKHKLLEFMCAFRETFSRPVKPIRFLGLFDTVNSVPAFENAWMQRSRFPYTARSSARVIRHAVSIDERRAKFRQDLISQERPDKSLYYKHHHKHGDKLRGLVHGHSEQNEQDNKQTQENTRGRSQNLAPPERYRNPHDTSGVRSSSVGCSHLDDNPRSATPSMRSIDVHGTYNSADEEGEQDIQEVWFPGCHAVSTFSSSMAHVRNTDATQDIGGGWPLVEGEVSLSHVPLVWMVREAQKAGLEFDEEKLVALDCCHEDAVNGTVKPYDNVPTIEVDPASPLPVDSDANASSGITGYTDDENILAHHQEFPDTRFHKHLHVAATQGRIHDVLQFNNGAGRMGVMSWNMMEYLPFRRMDLQEDGSWKAIRWPLPKGETRDIPANAVIHGSAIKRMHADSKYRPGNLIVGGGGRGVRHAPKDYGIGKWVAAHEEGHYVGECFVRRFPPERTQSDETAPLARSGASKDDFLSSRKKSTATY